MLCIQCLPSYAYGETDSLANDRYSLYYYQDRIDLQEDYLDNALQMARIRRVLTASPRTDSIAIYAYAFPEGNPRGNELLAKKRAEVARDFILANLPNDSVLLPQNIILHPVRTRSFKAPVWALKTNLLYDAALIPNLGIEFYLGKNFSIAANWHYAWWNTKSWFWRTYGGELAVRKWLGSAARERALTGHHVGVYAQVLAYDFMVGQHGYISGHPGETLFDRPNYTVGLEYGYSMPIAKRLSLDFVLGVGYHGGLYNEYLYMDDHYVWHTTKKRSFFGPNKAEVTLVWLLGPVNKKKGGDR